MKTLITTVLFLVMTLYCGFLAADGFKNQLTRNVWKMERQTGLGKVITVWIFLDDGSGTAYQKVSRHDHASAHNHRFTYKTENNRIIVQEEIAEEWEGHFGVTRWRLVDNKLVGEVRFRDEPLIFMPMDL